MRLHDPTTSGLYVLDGHEVRPASDILEWGVKFRQDRVVAKTQVSETILVSTVFLGIDHGFSVDRPPLLFETMVFGDGEDDLMGRCSTWEQAEEMHKRVVGKFVS